MAEVIVPTVLPQLLEFLFGKKGNPEADALRKSNEELRGQIAATQKQLDELTAIIKDNDKIKSLTDLSKQEAKIFDQVVELCRAEPAYKMDGNNIGFFGIVSVGKSSLINALMGQNVAETGLGETTLSYHPYQGIGLTYWDCPGKHDELNYLTADYISLIKGLSKRLVIIDSTMKHVTGLIKLLQRLNLSFTLVVNKYDIAAKASPQQRAKFDATIETEVNEYCPGVPIFRVSSEQPGQHDWDALVQAITSAS